MTNADAPDTRTPPVVDLAHLRMMTMEDVSLAREVIAIFRNQADMWGRLLWPNVSPEVWADAAHTIKGAAAGLGAERLKLACAHAEMLGRAANVSPVAASVALQDVREQLDATLTVFGRIDYELAVSGDFSVALRRSHASNS
jgi:hypothetical protein